MGKRLMISKYLFNNIEEALMDPLANTIMSSLLFQRDSLDLFFSLDTKPVFSTVMREFKPTPSYLYSLTRSEPTSDFYVEHKYQKYEYKGYYVYSNIKYIPVISDGI